MARIAQIDRQLIERAILLARHASDDLASNPARKPRAQELHRTLARLADIQSTLSAVLS